MKETRTATLKSKRVTTDNIRAIAHIIETNHRSLLENHRKRIKTNEIRQGVWEPELSAHLKTRDNVEFDTESVELLKSGGVLDTTVVKQIELALSYSAEEIRIGICVADSEYSYSGSNIRVSGTDDLWVGGVFSSLMENVNTWQNQNSIFIKLKWPISILLAIAGAAGITWLFSLLLPAPISTLQTSVLGIIISAAFWAILWILPEYIAKAYPDIEVVQPLAHERNAEKRRERLKFIITGILLPFFISLVANWLQRQRS